MVAVTVWSRGAGAETYKITLRRTGPTTGQIEIATWPAGRGPSGNAPATVETYNLYEVRIEANGDLKCRVNRPNGLDPALTCRLERPVGGQPRVKIWVEFVPYTYPLSSDDFTALGDFLVPTTFA